MAPLTVIACFSLSSCDNSTAQQENKNTGKIVNTKPKNNDNVIAPDFSLADLQGNTITLEQMRGKVILLNFGERGVGHAEKKYRIL